MTDITQGTAGQSKAGFQAVASEVRKTKAPKPAKPLSAAEQSGAKAQTQRERTTRSSVQTYSGF